MSDIEERCSVLSIPERLHTAGRPKDPVFDEEELLYRRFFMLGPKEEWSMVGNDPSAQIFDLSEDSYNRSKYCEQAEDVLYNTKQEHNLGQHYNNAGILSLKIHQLLSDDTIVVDRNIPNVERRFTFGVEHAPEPCMYPHSNVNVLVNGEVAPKRPASIKLALRLILRDYAGIIKEYR